MKIKVEKFLMKQGNRVGKAAIQFGENDDPLLRGFHLLGFTICDDDQKGMFVLFPAAITDKKDVRKGQETEKNRPYFFLRPESPELLDKLQDAILDVYDSMSGQEYANRPRMSGSLKVQDEVAGV